MSYIHLTPTHVVNKKKNQYNNPANPAGAIVYTSTVVSLGADDLLELVVLVELAFRSRAVSVMMELGDWISSTTSLKPSSVSSFKSSS
jgi:hypothetical protein